MTEKSIDPKKVEEFLLLNPEFLSDNSHILNSLEIVHETGGAVSLIQKQVEILRKNYESTSGNLLQLLEIASTNEDIFEKTKKLILNLIVCKNLTEIVSVTEETFSKEFQSDSCKLLFFKDNPNLPKGRIVDAKEAHKVIGSKYNAADIFCGPLDQKESSYIFDKKAEVLDCVLVPIKNSECPGVLAVGSRTENTYSKENDSLFLEFISEALSKLIERSNQNLWGFELGSIIEQIQYTEYHAEDKGHYDWHLDIGNDQYSLRKISLTVQLSDPNDYEGGLLELNHAGDDKSITAPTTKGSVFVFPSYLRHRVTPVTKGIRKSLVLWVGGNQFR